MFVSRKEFNKLVADLDQRSAYLNNIVGAINSRLDKLENSVNQRSGWNFFDLPREDTPTRIDSLEDGLESVLKFLKLEIVTESEKTIAKKVKKAKR